MKKDGFTLLELLVVVGIIGILAAIAVPNYRDAVTKSRIVLVQMDLRTLGTALHSYRLDHNIYPRKQNNLLFFVEFLISDLTTPVSYLSSAIKKDPFGPVTEFEIKDTFNGETVEYVRAPTLVKNSYTYTPYMSFSVILSNSGLRREGFALTSVGPDRMDSYIVDYPFPEYYRYPGDTVRDSVYNPSNGIISSGDIGFFGGDIPVSGLIGG
ncbi:MAG: prepilin-type N-terminal cleavage/methylation domain-containing protein [Candidatus Omnitrophota bacterium]